MDDNGVFLRARKTARHILHNETLSLINHGLYGNHVAY